MSKLLFSKILILFILFSSCDQGIKINHDKAESIEDVYRIESEKKEEVNEILLGFKLNQHIDSFKVNIKKLIAKKEILLEDDRFYYILNCSQSIKIKCELFPEFYNDKLYKVRLFAKPDLFSINTPDLINISIQSLFLEKYSVPTYRPKSIDNENEDYVWVNSNREIRVMDAITETVIIYVDHKVEKVKREKDDKTDQIEKQKSLKSI
jgi:hypothetical protein